MTDLRRPGDRRRETQTAFFINFALALVVLLPFIIRHGGVLTLFADFNKQQIPFGIYANAKIKAGDIAWSWSADLGTNFIGAFSFYNLGSPFFWLSLLFPANFFPYLIGPLLMLKIAVAGVAAQLYLRRFVRLPQTALLGSVLYAWSGFQMTNLQFNHFHDVVAFFPFFLLALEYLVQEKRRGWFALMTAVMATLNYFFFVGQVVFLIIYFAFRFKAPENRKTGEGFFRLGGRVLFEGTLGVLMAAWIFLPSTLFVSGNPRSSLSAFDANYIFYYGKTYLMLLRSAFFPPDPMGLNSAVYGTEYSSIAFYLPLFGVTAVTVFMRRSKGLLGRLLLTCLIMALFPLTNSAFFAFNGTYYARWFYMPGLIAVLMTVILLERGVYIRDRERLDRLAEIGGRSWIYFGKRDLLCPGLLTLGFALLIFIWPEAFSGKLLYLPVYWLFNVSLALVAYLLTAFLLKRTAKLNRDDPNTRTQRGKLMSLAIILVFLFTSLHGWVSVYRMQHSERFDQPAVIQAKLYQAGLEIGRQMPQDDIYRIYHERVNWNIAFVADLAPVNAFISTISASTFDFYESLGYQRFVYTHMPESYSGLLSFLSVDYIIQESWRDDLDLFYEYKSQEGSVYVFRRPAEDRLPFGFTMDRYIKMEDFLQVEPSKRHRLLVEAVILDEASRQAIEGNTSLERLTPDGIRSILAGSSEEALAARRASAPVSSRRDRLGFTAEYQLAEAGFAYYSVPYDSGWEARVNGEMAKIVEANGFMLLALEAGSSEVDFRYRVPGLRPGLIISLIACLIFLGYLLRRRLGTKAAGQRKGVYALAKRRNKV